MDNHLDELFSVPVVIWGHYRGPVLVCSDGSIHFLGWVERMKLELGWVTVETLDRKHRKVEVGLLS